MVTGNAGWQLHPIMVPSPQDVIIQKQMPSAFYQATRDEYLSAHGIHKLVIAGIQTELCVDTTCREARSRDYDVTLIHDAHSTWERGRLTAPQIIPITMRCSAHRLQSEKLAGRLGYRRMVGLPNAWRAIAREWL